jgi:uncharacterized membrane protein (GlpM family)
MIGLFFKCALGAAVVLLISLLSKSRSFYIAGLVPLFPTFALIAHVIVFGQQGAEALRKTALFGLWSLIPMPFILERCITLQIGSRLGCVSALQHWHGYWLRQFCYMAGRLFILLKA